MSWVLGDAGFEEGRFGFLKPLRACYACGTRCLAPERSPYSLFCL